MAQILFSSLLNGQHISFNAALDVLRFAGAADQAAAVRLVVSGANLGVVFAGKTIWLDNLALAGLTTASFSFANGSSLLVGDGTVSAMPDWYGKTYSLAASTVDNQVRGLGGADRVTTGSGHDYLVGNDALAPITHVSRLGGVGSPTNSYGASISADGNLVAFGGSWTGFGSSNNTAVDVFVKNLQTGVVQNEERNAAGVLGLSGSDNPMISADGSTLVFTSSAALVPGTPPNGTIYQAAVNGAAIAAVSVTAGGVFANGASVNADVSSDGRYVTFATTATNFAAGGSVSTYDIYRKDMVTGALVRISTGQTGIDANGDCTHPRISPDGRYVVFSSTATNLTTAETGSFYADVYVWDSATSSLTNITAAAGLADSLNPDVDAAGNVVFQTRRALVAADTNTSFDIYSYNLTTHAYRLVSATATGTAVTFGDSENASISGDGRYVVFASSAASLVAGDSNGYTDIFVKDLLTGAIALVSRTPTAQGNGSSGGAPQISLGGDWIVFESSATNLATTDANTYLTDVFRVANPLLQDTLTGGAGNDTYVLARNDIVVEAVGGGTDTVQSSISHALGANVENLVLLGTAGLSGTGNALNNVITGTLGNNLINGLGGVDTASYAAATTGVSVSLAVAGAQATGGGGSDTLISIENLTGSGANDSLTGDALANTLNGGLGNDTLTGGDGNDVFVVDSAADVIVESAAVSGGVDTVVSAVTWTLGALLENLILSGVALINGTGNTKANVLTGNAAANVLSGLAGNDSITGGAGNDSVLGGLGDDRLDGGTGNDTLTGGDGNDSYLVDSSADVIVESATVAGGVDTVNATVTWALGATLENLTLGGTATINGSGNSANNALTGNAAANVLVGNAGNDTLNGGLGNDTLTGGAGTDVLTGGGGADAFVFNSTVGADVVTDFTSGSDRLRVSMASLPVGDGDLLIENSSLTAATGGFSAAAELVVFSTDVASLSTATAAARIGSATSGFTLGQHVLFAVDTGGQTGLYLFTSSGTDALVSAAELTLLATLTATPTTVLADYLFVA
ncbi:beta strand repeat-containing protein [Rhodobacter ferrooxidans]|uniref:HlyA-like protein n=1 Tax=Rhodobacter ferrooxidans TaxID=371731 RepID=C8S0L0_9RHOB|nr:PD40 domain-containing protein [Rhodobacter sp. SW2]EEW25544.1 hlyA-like protein [Rhodobacter sp. SW2]